MNYALIPTPLGEALATSDGSCLTGLWLPGQPHPDISGAVQAADPILSRTRLWLDRYFRGENPEADIPLSPAGTEFQRRVWALLRDIPYGESTTYGALATRFGKMSAQAVGQAVGANPISVMVPCHRVLGSGGKLTGYAGGVEKKRFLLELEGIAYKE